MRFLTSCLAITLAASLCGCAMSNPSAVDTPTENTQTTESENNDGGIYFADFTDIPIPKEMSVDHQKSLVIGTLSRQTGVLVLTGRVNAPSLYRFYYDTMPGQGFTLRGFFKHAKSLMIFEKQGKDVIILVDEGTISTTAEIWVVLRSDTNDTPLQSSSIPKAIPQNSYSTSNGNSTY
ncbi:hypothetical protein [Desulfovibrio inopinatus]|uniref:hypothetical protein n=1 Tax=Desulfovibrio inopinatus TaxID=102109 RepID=UPI000418ED94|nr:hypothetical protein [Desulfovibrio inopinatus]